MAWHGMVWHGMVRHGMVWYGMVWYGMVPSSWGTCGPVCRDDVTGMAMSSIAGKSLHGMTSQARDWNVHVLVLIN